MHEKKSPRTHPSTLHTEEGPSWLLLWLLCGTSAKPTCVTKAMWCLSVATYST